MKVSVSMEQISFAISAVGWLMIHLQCEAQTGDSAAAPLFQNKTL